MEATTLWWTLWERATVDQRITLLVLAIRCFGIDALDSVCEHVGVTPLGTEGATVSAVSSYGGGAF